MDGENIKDRILETIDALRRRKARPDLERICHMINKRYGTATRDIEIELEGLVDTEIVIKVEYKGNTSYRNAAKWRKSHLSGNVLNSNSDTRTILAAVESISERNIQTPGSASFEEIEKFLLEQNTSTGLLKGRLRSALQREIDVGHILHDPEGTYRCTERGPKRDIVRKFGRPMKRKRIRKTHGPDFEQELLIKLSPGDQRCDYCSLPSSKNKYGDSEELLVCKDCALKVHPSCMNYSPDLAERSRLSPWQCIDCKTCHLCNSSGDADTLLFCDACDKGYHMSCHKPELTEKPSGKWVCSLCEKEEEEMESSSSPSGAGEASLISDGDDSGSSVTVACSPFIPEELNRETISVQYEETNRKSTPEVAIPNQSQTANLPEQSARDSALPQITSNPSLWNIDEVVEYFNSQGFKDFANAFKDQEIDGQSLLLMKRSDVLTGLSIRLGPALKIYEHVSRLQLVPETDDSIASTSQTAPTKEKPT